MSNDEKRDIEDRINDAMAKIVSDTAGEPQPENKNNRSAAHKSARPSKSARPRKITYVPIDESEFEPIVIPEKSSHPFIGLLRFQKLQNFTTGYITITDIRSFYRLRFLISGLYLDGIAFHFFCDLLLNLICSPVGAVNPVNRCALKEMTGVIIRYSCICTACHYQNHGGDHSGYLQCFMLFL